MNRSKRLVSLTLAVCLTGAATFATGCDGGPSGNDFSFNLIVPVGLGGSPGILNPFGIIQAIVNAWLGNVLPSSGSGNSSTTGTTSTSPTPSTLGAIGATVQQQS